MLSMINKERGKTEFEYNYISFLVSSIDYDYSKNCNRLRLLSVINFILQRMCHVIWFCDEGIDLGEN